MGHLSLLFGAILLGIVALYIWAHVPKHRDANVLIEQQVAAPAQEQNAQIRVAPAAGTTSVPVPI